MYLDRVDFDPKFHKYTNSKNEIYTSASQLVHKYTNDFKEVEVYWALYTAIREYMKMEKPDFSKFLIKKFRFDFKGPKDINILFRIAHDLGMSPEEGKKAVEDTIAKWKTDNKKSTDRGTLFHNNIENVQRLSGTYLSPDQVNYKVLPIQDFTYLEDTTFGKYTPETIPELRLYNHKYKIAGTTDQPLFEYPYVDINDWKGLALDTPMLTSTGWKYIGTLNKGDNIYSGDGKLTTIINVSEIHYNPCYKIIFDTNEEIICDHEHKWEVGNEILTTEQLASKKSFKGFPISIPIIEQETKDLPIDPYVLGLYLADGNCTCGTITCLNKDIWNEVKGRGYEISENHNKNNKKAESRTVYGIRRHLVELGVLNNKHIPSIYFNSSYAQRLDLLRGFMDGDGYFHKARKRCSMQTTKLWQKDAFVTLLSSLGIKPTIFETKGVGFAGEFDKYDVCFTSKENPFLIRNTDYLEILGEKRITNIRKIKSIDLVTTVPTKCLEVEAECHTYLAGTGLIKTHNTNKRLDFQNKWNKMLYPLNHLDDCNINHYQIQLSLYAWMLEQFGYKPRNLGITHIIFDEADNVLGSQYHAFTYMKREVELMLEHYANTGH